MTAMPDTPAPWGGLVKELEEWRRRGLQASFWARDDDAIALTPQLDRLIAAAAAVHIEIGLAIIPARLTAPLAAYLLSGNAPFYPMCHGWRHVNYSEPMRPSEFGPDRALPILIEEAKCAHEAFSQRFGALPAVFVPPFARISPSLIAELPGVGFRGISIGPAATERRYARLASYLPASMPFWPALSSQARRYEVHIDPFDWRRGGARSRQAIAREATGYLRARRFGVIPAARPIGLLLHHLVFDEDTWKICQELLAILASHPSVKWPTIRMFIEDKADAGSSDVKDRAA